MTPQQTHRFSCRQYENKHMLQESKRSLG